MEDKLMNSMAFWVARKKWIALIFQLKKIVFQIFELASEKKSSFSFYSSIAWIVISKIILWGIFALILYKIDILVMFQYPIIIKNEIYISILIAGLSISGIILGLYCSNIASIYSTRYINAPSSLSKMFEHDVVTNRCIKQIVGYIIFDLILIFEVLLNIQYGICSIIIVIILTIFMIVSFALMGNRSYQLSDTYIIGHILYPEIYSIVKNMTKNNFLYSDISFQHYYQKICSMKLAILKDIAIYNQMNPSNQSSAMIKFMNKNLELLSMYWQKKTAIYYDSFWYEQKAKYPQWHLTSDYIIGIALKTGTMLNTSTQKNLYWFEEKIMEVNNICFDKLCNEQDMHSIYTYLSNVSYIALNAVKGNSLEYILKYVESLQKRILPICVNEWSKNAEQSDDIIAGIADTLSVIYLNIIIGINQYLSLLNIDSILNSAKCCDKFKFANFKDNEFFNFPIAERMYRCIEAEKQIEHRRITPDWFIEQTISQNIYDRICEFIYILDAIYNRNVLQIGNNFQDNKLYFPAIIIFSKMPEFNSKIEVTLSYLNQFIPTLLEKRFESTILWKDNPLPNFLMEKDRTTTKIPACWAKCSEIYALQHWEKKDRYPDLLGFSYNNFCEYLVSAIEANDFEKFKCAYPYFMDLMMLYQQYILNDVKSIREDHLQNIVFHVYTAPNIEYAMISGLAIIWGEFSNVPCWTQLVEESLKEFVEKDKEKNIEVLLKLVEMEKIRRNHLLGIGNRDVLQTAWEQRISHAIRQSNLYKFEYQRFGTKVIKTNSKLLKAFCGSSFETFGFNKTEEVYFITCVNKYLQDNNKFKSQFNWERRMDNEEEF